MRGTAAAGLAGAVAAACGGSLPPRPAPTTSTPTPTARPADWAALGRRLAGPLVRPGDARYAAATRLADPRFDGSRPQGVAYCSSTADVAACVAFARDGGVPLALRSGGHSYGGWSSGTGLVLDVSALNGITVAGGPSPRATVGAGVRIVDLYATLDRSGLTVPSGSCPTVGVAGVTLGGGVGVVGRAHGLTSDRLVSAQVVTADGRVRTCSADEEPDLFWACRGGGGGSFGVVTSFTFAPVTTGPVTTFSYGWPWSRAATVLAAWTGWASGAADELWSDCQLLATTGGAGDTPTVRVNGVWLGDANALDRQLAPLVAAAGSPSDTGARTRPYLDAMLLEAGCLGRSAGQCHLGGSLPGQSAAGTLNRASQVAASDYLDRALPESGAAAVAAAVEARQRARLGQGGAAFDAYGGAINRVAAADTAFVHRSSVCSVQYTAAVTAAAQVDRQWASLRRIQAALRPHVSGQAYVNYADPDLAGWARAYYGSNLERLMATKREYDARDLFRFPQSVPIA